MKIKRYKLSILFFLIVCYIPINGQRTINSKNKKPIPLIKKGGAFIDLFKPVPVKNGLESNTWGAANVIPRDIQNGIEDSKYSYWGGNIIHGKDGKEHLFVCRWNESEPRGHSVWWKSEVVHAISDDPIGPYTVKDIIGKGHNPEIYQTKDGIWIIGVMHDKAYKSKSLNGPWTEIKPSFNFMGEVLNKTNRTYILQEDGTIFMMNKNGFLFESKKGIENFTQIKQKSVYPKIRGAHLEDPVIWKDEVQYHYVVNDWKGRKAYYLRSPDGINWKLDPGYAYDPSIMNHVDGSNEGWYKFERPKVRQDKYGRATHMNFAVIDTVKAGDLGSDNHSSKNVVIPLTISRRLHILNKKKITSSTSKIEIEILAEEGFNPHTDIDIRSLKCGIPEEVNFGKGGSVLSSKKSGANLIVTFSGKGNKVGKDDFVLKIIGKTSQGKLLFGYSKLPLNK